jgi:hypothetical protein
MVYLDKQIQLGPAGFEAFEAYRLKILRPEALAAGNIPCPGARYWRVADLRDGVMRTVMSRRFEVPEITAAQAEEVNKRLPTFNNSMSMVYQIGSNDDGSNYERKPLAPFQADTDWTSADAPCGPPVK